MTHKQQESCNKFLVEWMRKQGVDVCWHKHCIGGNICYKCGIGFNVQSHHLRPNYFDRSQFWDLWEVAVKSEEWKKFNGDGESIPISLVNYQTFAYEWAKFLGWREE